MGSSFTAILCSPRLGPAASKGCRRSMEKKVRTLRKLIPNSEFMGLDGLFREAAMHIRSLQMRVKAMQVMVDVLAGSDQ
ncbi:hypothetical protein Acr_23g0020310 [Actinidia rufa]|uniref:Sequence-specific DNA binding transcription factor n=1 Tax=Actinidia rufa TaxID=165716 RepID=A0A7J0GS67_9ERIC|nr:hypothetical protein Acr_23g0020310 [Actinidia rufa]